MNKEEREGERRTKREREGERKWGGGGGERQKEEVNNLLLSVRQAGRAVLGMEIAVPEKTVA